MQRERLFCEFFLLHTKGSIPLDTNTIFMRLSDPITEAFRLSDAHKQALARLGVRTLRDLLFHFPFRYDVAGDESSISGLIAGQEVSLIGNLEKLEAKKGWKS